MTVASDTQRIWEMVGECTVSVLPRSRIQARSSAQDDGVYAASRLHVFEHGMIGLIQLSDQPQLEENGSATSGLASVPLVYRMSSPPKN